MPCVPASASPPVPRAIAPKEAVARLRSPRTSGLVDRPRRSVGRSITSFAMPIVNWINSMASARTTTTPGAAPAIPAIAATSTAFRSDGNG
jgi:hypothetical protein